MPERERRVDSTVDVVIESDFAQYCPRCPACKQEGRERAAGPMERQFICALCGVRWVVRKSRDLGLHQWMST